VSVSTALVNYAASGKTSSNAWREVVLDYCTDFNVDNFKTRCHVAASEFKEKHKEGIEKSVIDNAVNNLRSAQSVIVNSNKLMLPLLDENGNPRGKSALQAEIKTAKGETKKELTDKDRIGKAIYLLVECTSVPQEYVNPLNELYSTL
jgi:hypothetical protein